MALNRAKVSRAISLTTGLSFLVFVDYFDSADPATLLWSEQFVLPLTSSTADLQARVVERGQTIRQALGLLAGAQAAVPDGATVTVP